MSWPHHFATTSLSMPDRVAVDSRAFAQMTQAFVISACGLVDEAYIQRVEAGAEGEHFLRQPECTGGSIIVGPSSRVVAGPMGREEGILYADCDLEEGVQAKIRHDFAGHYNRPNVFTLKVNRTAPAIYVADGGKGEPPAEAAIALGLPAPEGEA